MGEYPITIVQWFALSPSPFTIIFYLILTAYGMKQIFKDLVILRKRDYLLVFTDAALIVGLVVVFLDTFWILFSGLRFGASYPDSILQLVFAAGRNVTAVIFCLLLTGLNFFKSGLLRITKKTYLIFLVNLVFLTVWFALARSPAFTDWTFAIRHDYPVYDVMLSFFISHVIGKSIVTAIYLSIWHS